MTLSSPLLTDLYQLTMAQAAWSSKRHLDQVCFHLFFRKSPFQGGYALAAGLADAVAFLEQLHFTAEELDYVSKLRGADDKPLFQAGFLDILENLDFACDVDAIPEGTVVFPHEPLLRITGPWWQAQLIETALLNILNFQTLIATKASRICQAAAGSPVLEFGLRRAQGSDGALSATRAAFIGGIEATSNVLAGMRLGIPVKGTHAHSWVMAYDDERASFDAYADALPNNCVFLVDTYDTFDGVRNAIRTGLRLREMGQDLLGIRLDSGDLAWLSQEARRLLDAAGFSATRIVASNDLDEYLIESLRHQGAAIDVWGVGTKLVTAYDQPALGGVYKLGAVRDAEGNWQPRIKLSEQSIKISNPGRLNVRRFVAGGRFVADAIWNEDLGFDTKGRLHDPEDYARGKEPMEAWEESDLLMPIFREGRRVADTPALTQIRDRAAGQIAALDPACRRLRNAHRYPAGIENRLWNLRLRMVEAARPKRSLP